ncbi:hypothetical protein [Thermobispora bispora]|uniref:Uncharacterized protein n=1 Tax=Thermobispora bispora (strain ATCC 19993 / DSM 43833 / CBS 139.67 / JCM 10125 / KCTC 9307 / NBRC 14880 / R51) TaxID=469371 RepID=D6Y5C9_THEBD|nr:hypothetical protein [Thermobispora bispora]ADG89324.1 hypothetical protein Tbis_2623 [Thermobispora bispora DSM 43833]
MIFKRRTRPSEALRVGRPDARPQDPSHTKGVLEGNAPGHYEMQPGHLPDGRSTAERSTGINPELRNPIDRRMPNISPP